ncbi:MAG: acyl-CoA dehydrogenase domain-containing protein, partial [Thiohalomonadales bacterium]
GIYLPNLDDKQSTEPLAQIENALHAVIAAEPYEKKLRSALRSGNISVDTREAEIQYGVECNAIDPIEADSIREADIAREKVIRVDQFTNDQLRNIETTNESKPDSVAQVNFSATTDEIDKGDNIERSDNETNTSASADSAVSDSSSSEKSGSDSGSGSEKSGSESNDPNKKSPPTENTQECA